MTNLTEPFTQADIEQHRYWLGVAVKDVEFTRLESEDAMKTYWLGSAGRLYGVWFDLEVVEFDPANDEDDRIDPVVLQAWWKRREADR